MKNKYRICIFGLGYVGLPLAIEFGKKIETVGYDINKKRISHLSKRNDFNNDIKPIEFQRSKKLIFTGIGTTDLQNLFFCFSINSNPPCFKYLLLTFKFIVPF